MEFCLVITNFFTSMLSKFRWNGLEVTFNLTSSREKWRQIYKFVDYKTHSRHFKNILISITIYLDIFSIHIIFKHFDRKYIFFSPLKMFSSDRNSPCIGQLLSNAMTVYTLIEKRWRQGFMSKYVHKST